MSQSTDNTLSLGFDAGNYAEAYETSDYSQAIASLSPNRSHDYVSAFTLGFFSSYTLDEMGAHSHTYLNALNSKAGRRCIELGWIDANDCYPCDSGCPYGGLGPDCR
jgi:hypothetical protein